MQVIVTHNNADFDAVASQLAAHKLFPEAVPVLPVRVNRDVSEFIMLYRSGLPFVNWYDARVKSLTRIIMTDTANAPSIRGARKHTPTLIIDHHTPDRPPAPHETWWYEPVGATTTLLVEEIRRRQINLSLLEATLLALGIYADTGLLTYNQTTPRDVLAVAWLIEQGAELDTIRRFLVTPLTDAQQSLYLALSQAAETRLIHGYAVTVCAAQVDKMIEGINVITKRIAETLEPTAIIALVAADGMVQLVARSSDDAVNVGALASDLGGGGHPRAAAAAIEGRSLEEVRQAVWSWLELTVKPTATVRQLMSRGAQTVAPDDVIREIVPRLRRIGHEGYPVLEDGRVIGLLTRRDADRALEHGLHNATVRDVMQAGAVFLSPDDSVASLESLMLESGWGQIPVVENGQLVGIVTRTDLLRYWVSTHPRPRPTADATTTTALEDAFEPAIARLLHLIGQEAQAVGASAYLVGGVVRDYLLKRPNHDIDIVIEQDAIRFVESLCRRCGGSSSSYAPFGTAKWLLDDKVAEHLQTPRDALPPVVDFATARYETYAYPTALPSVYHSSITLDLRRRDFTINAMALQISPLKSAGTLIDIFGGQHDLERKLIRVLHSLSFVDDPTRILRAVRFANRYNFELEPRTHELLISALPMLGRITGERLRNELSWLFAEPSAPQALRQMHALGIDRAMTPHLHFTETIVQRVERLWQHRDQLQEDVEWLHWHLLLADLGPQPLQEVVTRFLLPGQQARHIQHTAQLWQTEALHHPETPPSQIVALLEHAHPSTLEALWLLGNEGEVSRYVEQFRSVWRTLKPTTTGHTLRALGVAAGPAYRRILSHLRDAYLDGMIHTQEEEQELLRTLLQDEAHDHP
jgi:tRNA nucleotidyltransferase (CCA-adding enzyme)